MKIPSFLTDGVELAERGLLPDAVVRLGIRRLLAKRLAEQSHHSAEAQAQTMTRFVANMRQSPVAPHADKANEQHYEVPSEFFALVLGKHLKYSCAYFDENARTLDDAEKCMLGMYAQRAELEDGMRILELGCGWGSLCLWLAQRYPNSSIVALSNSHTQREHIEARARERGLANLQVVTSDVREFVTDKRFDRVLSIEMFEHVRNYAALFERIATWLQPSGKFFMHIFCHREFAYPFETDAEDDWMGRHFFTGGMMPSLDLPLFFQTHLEFEERFRVDGTHYAKTAKAWLDNLDRNKSKALETLASPHAERMLNRWRMFFLACEELFAYRNGREWGVVHYRFCKAAR